MFLPLTKPKRMYLFGVVVVCACFFHVNKFSCCPFKEVASISHTAWKRAHLTELLRVATATWIRRESCASSITWPTVADIGAYWNQKSREKRAKFELQIFVFIPFFFLNSIYNKNRPKITTRYPVSRTTSFIGPIPSPILQEESRLKTRKIPFATPLVTASLFTNQIVSIGDVDLASISSSISGSRADTLPPFPLFGLWWIPVNRIRKFNLKKGE